MNGAGIETGMHKLLMLFLPRTPTIFNVFRFDFDLRSLWNAPRGFNQDPMNGTVGQRTVARLEVLLSKVSAEKSMALGNEFATIPCGYSRYSRGGY